MIKVVILGGGNVSYHLTTHFLESTQIEVVQIYNRTIENIAQFKSKTSLTNNLKELKEADIYIITVSDDAISKLSSELNLKNKLVVHTSGSISIDALKSNSNKGVFYLLQSFSKDNQVDFSNIPICIEAERNEDLLIIQKLGNILSKNVYFIDSSQRQKLHIAAVFVNNFVNHLYHLGNDICNENNVPFEILQPLIEETARKVSNLSPFEAQTGPAKRMDTKTIEKHKAMLTESQEEIYTLLTKSIYKTYGEKL